MSLRKLLSLACPIACIACLAGGFAMAGRWVGIAAVLIAAAAWLPARLRPSNGSLLAALAITVGVAATGVLIGASPFLMILGAALALAGWDLVRFDTVLTGGSSAGAASGLEKKHYESLALALVPGLLAAVAGRMIHVQIPFVIMILLVVLALFSLDRVWRILTE